MNHEPQTTNYNTCQFCRFAGPAEGLDAGRLVCIQSEAASGSYKVVGCEETCDDWRLHAIHTFDPADVARDDTRLIPLSQGRFALVDAADYDKLSHMKWYAWKGRHTWYAVTHRDHRMPVTMHRLLMKAPAGMVVDHIDHNGLNNTRRNLRVCTYAQNVHNSRPKRNTSSKYKGVTRPKTRKKWQARIWHNKKSIRLGSFTDEKEAARAYDEKAKELFGEFAYLNFPDENRGQEGIGNRHEAIGTRQ